MVSITRKLQGRSHSLSCMRSRTHTFFLSSFSVCVPRLSSWISVSAFLCVCLSVSVSLVSSLLSSFSACSPPPYTHTYFFSLFRDFHPSLEGGLGSQDTGRLSPHDGRHPLSGHAEDVAGCWHQWEGQALRFTVQASSTRSGRQSCRLLQFMPR